MAITKRPSKAEEAFTGGAPDAGGGLPWRPQPKLRGKLQPVTVLLSPELIVRIAASREKRSRAKMIEIGMMDFLRRHEQEEAA
jgi:hypothetical protein